MRLRTSDEAFVLCRYPKINSGLDSDCGHPQSDSCDLRRESTHRYFYSVPASRFLVCASLRGRRGVSAMDMFGQMDHPMLEATLHANGWQYDAERECFTDGARRINYRLVLAL